MSLRVCVETEREPEHQRGRKRWDEAGAKVFRFPNPRNLGRRVGMGASEEIGGWYLLEVVVVERTQEKGSTGGTQPGGKRREPSGAGPT